jgi:hypothetical protein
MKPQTGERRDAISIPEPEPVAGEAPKNEAGIASLADADEGSAAATSETSTADSSSEKAEEARETVEGETADDDSVEAVGKEEAAVQDRDMMDEQDTAKEEDGIIEVDASNSTKVTTMFQKILSLGTQGGQVILGADGESDTKATPVAIPTPAAVPTGPSASQPTIVHNGRMVCYIVLFLYLYFPQRLTIASFRS